MWHITDCFPFDLLLLFIKMNIVLPCVDKVRHRKPVFELFCDTDHSLCLEEIFHYYATLSQNQLRI